MRRTDVIARIGSNAPCLICHLPPGSLTVNGRGDAAFLIPDLARQVWSATGLSDNERVSLNQLFASLLMCSRDLDESFSMRASRARGEILKLAAKNDELHALSAEFLDLLANGESMPARGDTTGPELGS